MHHQYRFAAELPPDSAGSLLPGYVPLADKHRGPGRPPKLAPLVPLPPISRVLRATDHAELFQRLVLALMGACMELDSTAVIVNNALTFVLDLLKRCMDVVTCKQQYEEKIAYILQRVGPTVSVAVAHQRLQEWSSIHRLHFSDCHLPLPPTTTIDDFFFPFKRAVIMLREEYAPLIRQLLSAPQRLSEKLQQTILRLQAVLYCEGPLPTTPQEYQSLVNVLVNIKKRVQEREQSRTTGPVLPPPLPPPSLVDEQLDLEVELNRFMEAPAEARDYSVFQQLGRELRQHRVPRYDTTDESTEEIVIQANEWLERCGFGGLNPEAPLEAIRVVDERSPTNLPNQLQRSVTQLSRSASQ